MTKEEAIRNILNVIDYLQDCIDGYYPNSGIDDKDRAKKDIDALYMAISLLEKSSIVPS